LVALPTFLEISPSSIIRTGLRGSSHSNRERTASAKSLGKTGLFK
jgi:hypothetical protein